jgi:predicted phosphodiesterase
VERNTTYYHPELDSRLISIQGNHDTGVEEFYRDCAFTNGNTRFICFFASYVGLPAPAGTYKSTGKISDATIAFIENELKATKDDESIEHIILVCHWSISHEKNFTWPIYDACPENGYSNNRQKLLDLAEEYGCDFYINGHEHNANYPTGKAGILTDINIASATSRWAVVEIHNRKIVFDVYSTAIANTKTGEITSPCAFVKTVEVDLTPREILTRK